MWFSGVRAAGDGDGFAIVYSRAEYDPDVEVPDTIIVAGLRDGAATPMGTLRSNGADIVGAQATIASNDRGALVVWNGPDAILYAAPVVGATAGSPVALGPAPSWLEHATITASDDGFLVAWLPDTGDRTFTLLRVANDGTPTAAPIISDGPSSITSGGDGYVAVWSRSIGIPSDPATELLAQRIPATGDALPEVVLFSGGFLDWMSPVAPMAGGGYRLLFSGFETGATERATWDLRFDDDGSITREAVPAATAAALGEVVAFVSDGVGYLAVSRVGSINRDHLELRVLDDATAVVAGPVILDEVPYDVDVAAGAPGHFAVSYRTAVDGEAGLRTYDVARPTDASLTATGATLALDDFETWSQLGCSAGGGNASALVLVAIITGLACRRRRRHSTAARHP